MSPKVFQIIEVMLQNSNSRKVCENLHLQSLPVLANLAEHAAVVRPRGVDFLVALQLRAFIGKVHCCGGHSGKCPFISTQPVSSSVQLFCSPSGTGR